MQNIVNTEDYSSYGWAIGLAMWLTAGISETFSVLMSSLNANSSGFGVLIMFFGLLINWHYAAKNSRQLKEKNERNRPD
mgnify:CR=1 FL=1|jgi:hypothetical protein|tara:strand:- start:541 stop:777 length:237 start_codon:yes stop_codon:yes gene_type:complete